VIHIKDVNRRLWPTPIVYLWEWKKGRVQERRGKIKEERKKERVKERKSERKEEWKKGRVKERKSERKDEWKKGKVKKRKRKKKGRVRERKSERKEEWKKGRVKKGRVKEKKSGRKEEWKKGRVSTSMYIMRFTKTYINMYIYIYTYIYVHICKMYIHMHKYVRACVFVCVCVCVYVCACVCACFCICIHTHIYAFKVCHQEFETVLRNLAFQLLLNLGQVSLLKIHFLRKVLKGRVFFVCSIFSNWSKCNLVRPVFPRLCISFSLCCIFCYWKISSLVNKVGLDSSETQTKASWGLFTSTTMSESDRDTDMCDARVSELKAYYQTLDSI